MTKQPSGSKAEKRQPAALHLATSCVSCFLVMLSITGCGAQASSTARVARTAGSAPNLKPVVVEAGVVLAGRDGYLCLPLEQVGVSPNASVVAIESSCECVQPRLVEHIAPSGTPEQALLLQYVADSDSENLAVESRQADAAPKNLGVLVDMRLAGGRSQQFTVNLLHTTLAEEAVQ